MNAWPQMRTDPLDRARRHVEQRLDGELSLNELADAAGLSPYHFSRQFTARFGFAPMAYVRARRLEIAAERLRAGPPTSLIDLALDCGFDSQEGFTRAFSRTFVPLAGQAGGGTFGVCCGGPAGVGLHYIAGVQVAADAPVPEGFEVIDLPARSYLVFRQVLDGGPLQPQMQSAVREIWSQRVPGSGHALVRAPDLEVYPEDFQPDKPGAWVEWWIPVEA